MEPVKTTCRTVAALLTVLMLTVSLVSCGHAPQGPATDSPVVIPPVTTAPGTTASVTTEAPVTEPPELPRAEVNTELVEIETYGEVLFSFDLIGDFQVNAGYCYCRDNLKAALAICAEKNPAARFMLSVGDQSEYGTAAEYGSILKIFQSKNVSLPVYLAVGNHERRNADYRDVVTARIKEFSGLETETVYYSFEADGAVFFVLGSEAQTAGEQEVYVSAAQYDWFAAGFEKAKNDGKIIFVVHHEPFCDTVSGSLPNQGWYGIESSAEGNCFGKLRAILDSYADCFVLSGHTHWTLTDDYAVRAGNGQGATYVNCSAVAYSWFGDGAGYTKTDGAGRYTGSEGFFVYVFADKVVFRGWDFAADCLIKDFVFPLYR